MLLRLILFADAMQISMFGVRFCVLDLSTFFFLVFLTPLC